MRAKRKKRRKHEECTWIRWKIGNWNSRYFAPVCRTFVFTFNPLFPLLVSKQKRKQYSRPSNMRLFISIYPIYTSKFVRII